MATTIDITGTILDAAGQPVENVVVRLAPSPRTVGSPELIAGEGLILSPVETLTDAAGQFVMPAIVGFFYSLEIPAIGYHEHFTCPAVNTSFHVLGLRPLITAVKDFVDANGDSKAIVQMATARVQTVMERFDQLIVEHAAALGGPWAAVGSPIVLLSNSNSYEQIDAAPDEYYRAYYRNSVTLEVSDYSDPVLGSSFAESLVISVAEMLEVYLFGVSLTDDKGNPYPTSMYEWYIKAATKWLEHELDMKIAATDIVGETHDHYAQDYGRWGYFQLQCYPVQRIDGVRFQYPSMTSAVVIDTDWVVLEEDGAHGVVQIVPGQGNIADVLLIPGQLMPMWSGAFGRVPGVWRFDYRAGFEADEIPADIKHVIGMAASIGVFNIAGDLIAGAGIASFSVGMPGVNQSVSTTSSATNAGYGARILEYQKEIKAALPALKRFYGKSSKLYVV